MKKTILTTSFIGIICLSFQSYAYIPNDVSRFENDTDCIRCNLTGSSFSSSWEKIEKSGGKFDGSFFTNFSLSGYKVIDASFFETNFVNSTVDYSEFNNTLFQRANLSHSYWYDVAFINSVLKDVNLSYVSMNGSFSSCSFNKVEFIESDLKSVSFSRAKMIEVNFTGAKLIEADFSRVNAQNVNFKNADLSYAILIGSNITEEQLSKTKTYKCATLSNGDVYTNNGKFNCK